MTTATLPKPEIKRTSIVSYFWADSTAELAVISELTWIRALLGVSVDLGSRPISRSIIQFISDSLAYLTIP
jgi:hypothetical protein